MKITKLFLTLFIIINSFAFSQVITFANYKLKDMGYVSIPSNLEVQSGLYKKLAESMQLSIGTITYEVLENRIVFQQKGVNIGEGKDTYARVIIRTEFGQTGDFPLLNSKAKLSAFELSEYSKEFKNQSFLNFGNKLVTWYGIENITLNGKYNGFKISYVRQLGDKPPVYVELYQINNNDRVHSITLSYRLEDSSTWKPLFKKIAESILIDKY